MYRNLLFNKMIILPFLQGIKGSIHSLTSQSDLFYPQNNPVWQVRLPKN